MADNYNVKDAAGATVTMAGKDIGSGVQSPKVTIVDASGVAGLIPGTAATSLGKAEDAAHTTGDTGVLVLGVRRDTPASGAGTDIDYATFNFDANGRLYCIIHSGTAANDIAKAEDGAHTSGDVGVPALAVRRDTAAVGSGTDGDYSTLNVDATGNLRVIDQSVSDAFITSISSANTTANAFSSQVVKTPVTITIDPGMTGTLTIDDGDAGGVVLGWSDSNGHHNPVGVFNCANLSQLRYTFSVNLGTSTFSVHCGI